MKSLSKEQYAQSRNIQAQVLQAAAKHKQSTLADCIGVDATTIGRWLDASSDDSKVVQFANILAYCDLRIVPDHMKCCDQQKIDILFRLAKDNFERLDVADDFFYDGLCV